MSGGGGTVSTGTTATATGGSGGAWPARGGQAHAIASTEATTSRRTLGLMGIRTSLAATVRWRHDGDGGI